MDLIDAWPPTRHIKARMAPEPESANVAVLTRRGIEIGPATATEARLDVDFLSAIRDDAPTEEKKHLVRAVLGIPNSR